MSATVIQFPTRPTPAATRVQPVQSEIVRTAGDRYKATQDLDIVKIAALVRADLKNAKKGEAGIPSDAKISVRISRYSMGQSLIIKITLPRVTRQPVDPARPDLDWVSTPEAGDVYEAAAEIAGRYNRSENDVLTDYFRSRYHVSLTVTGPSPL